MQESTNVMSPAAGRPLLWLTILVAASVAFTFGFACAVPFAAFGAATALTLKLRDALLLTVTMWLANQLVGFGALGYPWDAGTLIWGMVLGGVALLSTLAARAASARLGAAHGSLAILASFAAAFLVYEGGLYAVSAAWLGGTEDFAASIVIRIFEINIAALIGLLILNRLAATAGLAPSLPVATAELT